MNKLICETLALSFVDNFDTESSEITVCGYSVYHGLALIATYNEYGVPFVNVVEFNPDEMEDILDTSDDRVTLKVEEIHNPLTRNYDNALKLFLLCCGNKLHCVKLLGWDDLGYNRFNVDKLHDLLH